MGLQRVFEFDRDAVRMGDKPDPDASPWEFMLIRDALLVDAGKGMQLGVLHYLNERYNLFKCIKVTKM